jgi:hypothetical protein
MNIMDTPTLAPEPRRHPAGRKEIQWVRLLVGAYLGLSVLTLVAIVLLRDNTAMVTTPVWVRGSIVLASALLTSVFTAQMARGSRTGYLRVRLVSAIMLVAIAVIIALPDPFPVWLKAEQGVCGLLLLGVVVLVNGKQLRARFAGK